MSETIFVGNHFKMLALFNESNNTGEKVIKNNDSVTHIWNLSTSLIHQHNVNTNTTVTVLTQLQTNIKLNLVDMKIFKNYICEYVLMFRSVIPNGK